MLRMTRKTLAIVALFVLAVVPTAFAGTRSLDSGTRINTGATAGGIVSSVNGNLIHLAGGTITIDSTGAKINTTIEPGMILFATLKSSDVAPNAPLQAATITVTRIPDGTLFGPVQSVDVANNTLTLLGRTIHVTSETSFGGLHKSRDSAKPGLADILPNHIVQVTADESNGRLIASSVLLLAPMPPEVHATKGKVKTIGASSWVIERERGDDITVLIDAQTKIVGSPKAGDEVEVLYRVDSANAFVAISIIKFERPKPPPTIDVFRFSGKVESIEPHAWVVAKAETSEKVTLVIDRKTKIDPGVRTGDNVEVLAQRNSDGTVTALAIVRRLF